MLNLIINWITKIKTSGKAGLYLFGRNQLNSIKHDFKKMFL